MSGKRLQKDLSLQKIVSGAQTGADRAALDWAIARDVPHQGWCPAGRKSEDGAIDSRYRVRETPSANYIVRTEWNVRDSDGTVIISTRPQLTRGSAATERLAKRLGRPVLHICAEDFEPWEILRRFVELHGIRTLNVAGPRASHDPHIRDLVFEILDVAFCE